MGEIRNVAVIGIKDTETYLKICKLVEGDGFSEHEEHSHADEDYEDGTQVFYDDGDAKGFFYSWGGGFAEEEDYEHCTLHTVEEFLRKFDKPPKVNLGDIIGN